MSPDKQSDATSSTVRWQRLAVVLWTLLIVAVCLRGAWQQRVHSLYLTYAAAGAHWVEGTSLYYWGATEPGLEPYRYSPLVAVLLAPFHLLPVGLGSILWRLLNAGVLTGGLALWLRSALPWLPTPQQRAIVFLLVFPLAMGSLNNGQTNPLMVGLLLAGAATASTQRWNGAAACVALATALKVYPLAFGLLLAVAFPRRFVGRLTIALAVVAALPFLFQSREYVLGQYAEWLRVLAEDDRRFWPLHMAYRDLWLLFRVAGIPIGASTYQLIQVFTGGACAVICLAGKLAGWSAPRVVLAAFTLGTCWMTLCGPATESSTYILLAPALAWAVLGARVEGWPRWLRRLPDAAWALLLFGVLAGLSPRVRDLHGLGPQPLAALLLFAAYLATYLLALSRTPAPGIPREASPARAA